LVVLPAAAGFSSTELEEPDDEPSELAKSDVPEELDEPNPRNFSACFLIVSLSGMPDEEDVMKNITSRHTNANIKYRR